jgi:WD40 repeat protein
MDIGTGKDLRAINLQVECAGLAWAPDNVTLAIQDMHGGIQLFNTIDGGLVRKFDTDIERVKAPIQNGILYSPDGKTLLSVCCSPSESSGSQAFLIWDAKTGKLRRSVRAGASECSLLRATYSPDGKMLAWVSEKDGTVILSDTASGEEIAHLKETDSGLPGDVLVFDPSGRTLAVLSQFGIEFSIWDVASRKKVRGFPGPGPLIRNQQGIGLGTLSFSPDGKAVAVAGDRSAIPVFNVITGDEFRSDDFSPCPVNKVRFAANGKRLCSSDEDRVLRIWDLAGSQLRRVGTPRGASHPSFSDDGQLLAYEGLDGTVYVRQALTGKDVSQIVRKPYLYTRLCISPDNRFLAMGGTLGKRRVVSICATTTGKEEHRFTLPAETADPIFGDGIPGILAAPSMIVFSPDSRRLAVSADRNEVYIFDIISGEGLPPIQTPGFSHVRSFAFSSDGRSLALDCGEGAPSFWEVLTGQERRHFEDVSGEESSANYGPVGSVLGRLIEQYYRFDCSTVDLAVSPNGQLLAQSRPGGTISLWSMDLGKEIEQLKGHQSDVWTLAFAPDEKTLASGSRDSTILLWDLTSVMKDASRETMQAKVEALWNGLASEDATIAFGATRALSAAPARSVPFLRDRLLRPVVTDKANIERLIEELDHEQVETRKHAKEELEQIGDPAIPLLNKALENGPSVEVRTRIDALLRNMSGPIPRGERLRCLRAIEVLETVGTAEAQQVLTAVTREPARIRLSEEVKAALERLGKRGSAQKR